MEPLQWTTKEPWQSGWYWVRAHLEPEDALGRPRPAWIVQVRANRELPRNLQGHEFAGPIPRPVDPNAAPTRNLAMRGSY